MAIKGITAGGIGLRFLAAVILVFASYNPEGYSYYHWLKDTWESPSVLQLFAGIVLLIGWTVYLRATFRSLGPFGLILATAFFGTLVWLMIDLGWVTADSQKALHYLVLFAVCGVLTAGISWSHIRRRVTGQMDMDDLDEG